MTQRELLEEKCARNYDKYYEAVHRDIFADVDLDRFAEEIEKEVWKSKARYYLKDNDDLEILDQYNSEIRGFRNYYAIANNSAHANSFGYIMTESLFKTYATKYSAAKNRSSMRKEMSKRRIGKDFGVQFETKSGTKTRLLYNEGFARKRMPFNPEIDRIPLTAKKPSI